jgi:hypothetical protein
VLQPAERVPAVGPNVFKACTYLTDTGVATRPGSITTLTLSAHSHADTHASSARVAWATACTATDVTLWRDNEGACATKEKWWGYYWKAELGPKRVSVQWVKSEEHMQQHCPLTRSPAAGSSGSSCSSNSTSSSSNKRYTAGTAACVQRYLAMP